MLGKQHLRKIMLGANVVWLKRRRQMQMDALRLESLDYMGVRLRATNRDGNLRYPMFFQHRRRTDFVNYTGRLTFIAEQPTELSMQSIEGLLEADVVAWEMHFPMFFFRDEPPQGYAFQNKLTFMAEGDDTDCDCDICTGMVNFTREITINVIDPEKDFTKEFSINVTNPANDYTKVFTVNVIDPAKDYTKEFTVDVVEFAKTFTINVTDPTKDVLKEFAVNITDPAKDFTREFAVNITDPAKDFNKEFEIAIINQMGIMWLNPNQSPGGQVTVQEYTLHLHNRPSTLKRIVLFEAWPVTKFALPIPPEVALTMREITKYEHRGGIFDHTLSTLLSPELLPPEIRRSVIAPARRMIPSSLVPEIELYLPTPIVTLDLSTYEQVFRQVFGGLTQPISHLAIVSLPTPLNETGRTVPITWHD